MDYSKASVAKLLVKSNALSGDMRPFSKNHALSCCTMLTAAAFLVGISAAGNAEAKIYTYQGSVFTTQTVNGVAVAGVDRVTAKYGFGEAIDADGNDYSIKGLGGFEFVSRNARVEDKFDVNVDTNGNVTSWNINVFVDVGDDFNSTILSSNTSGDNASYQFANNKPCGLNGMAGDPACTFSFLGGINSTPGVWSPTFMDPSNWSLTSGGVPLVAGQGGYIVDLGNVGPGGYLQSSFILTNLNARVEGQALSGVFLAPQQVFNGGAFFSGFGEEFDLAGGESKTFTVSFDPIYAEYFGPYFGNASLVTARTRFGVKDSPDVSTPLFLRANLLEPAAVPEPASWAMMIAGFGMIGSAMRRRALQAT